LIFWSSAKEFVLRTLLITGGCGFIGSHFIKLLLRERPHYRIVNLDLLTYAGNPENLATEKRTEEGSAYRFVHGDIADVSLVVQLMQEESVDAIVNFAAETHVDRSLLDSAPFLRTNVEGTRVLLESAVGRGVHRFLQVSTDEVYGSLMPSEPSFTEENPLKPNSPYAASKAAADLMVRAYHRSYGVPALITRCGNNYGPYQFPEKFLPLFITNALDDRPLPLYGDGQQIRDWIHVEDHTRALLSVLETGSPGELYNISANGENTNQRMAEEVLRLLEKPQQLIRYVTDRPGHDRRYAVNASKLRRELGWQPIIDLEAGLRATIDWYGRERSWWERIKSGEYRAYYARLYGDRLGLRQ
jgi:dTDP-glucose 4,6-dehydratase